MLKRAAWPFGRTGQSPAQHARVRACVRAWDARTAWRLPLRGAALGRGRAHGTDDRQIEQCANHGHIAQEAERNREEVAAGRRGWLRLSRACSRAAAATTRALTTTTTPVPPRGVQRLFLPAARAAPAQPTLPPAGQGQRQRQRALLCSAHPNRLRNPKPSTPMPMTGQPSSTSPIPPKKHAVPGGRERGVARRSSVCVQLCERSALCCVRAALCCVRVALCCVRAAQLCWGPREVARRKSARSCRARAHP